MSVALENILTKHDRLSSKGSWTSPATHFDRVLVDPWYALIFRLSGEIAFSTQDYFRSAGFMPALTPVTAQSITSPMGLGSDSQPVSVNLMGRETYLVDSMQFHLEYLLRQYPQGIFYIMPTFRGEDSDARHLNEFFHIEAEFVGDLNDTLKTIEGLLQTYAKSIVRHNEKDVVAVAGSSAHLHELIAKSQTGFERVSFKEALYLLGDDSHFYKFLDDKKIALTDAGEKALMKKVGEPMWLTHLPAVGVPFYQANADEEYSLCADLLMGIGEVAGCGQRHLTYEETLEAINARNVDPVPYDWYLQLKKRYPMQTSGFGIGLERFLLWVLKHDDIRDIQLIVRQKGLVSVP